MPLPVCQKLRLIALGLTPILLFFVFGFQISAIELTQITTNNGTDWMSSWSPDGSSIVYVSSPIVIDHQINPTQDIYIIPATGGTPTKLTTYNGIDGYTPRFSPDGSEILYSTTMQSQGLGLWTIPSSGGTPTRVYDSAHNDCFGSWNPDGNRIVFYSELTQPRALWIVDSSGENPWRLTYDNEDYVPCWSPDGSNILVHSTYRTGNQELWTISVPDGTPTQLTNTPWQEYCASYSPDGRWIAFGSNKSGDPGLWIMSAEGGEQILIADSIGWRAFPSWSPDGKKIAFDRSLSGDGIYDKDIWIASDLPIEPNIQDATIPLSIGWNLISLPFQPLDIAPESILSSVDGTYDSVWGHDPDTGWAVYTPGASSDLRKMKNGKGYWVKMDQPGNLVIRGTNAPSKAVYLKGGEWNLGGYSSLQPKNVEDCMRQVENDIDSVWEYNPETGWSIYVPGGASDLVTMKPGFGYWIKADRNCLWDLDTIDP